MGFYNGLPALLSSISDRVVFVDAYPPAVSPVADGLFGCIREIVRVRDSGERRPVLVFGFDSFAGIRERMGAAIFAAPGVSYLRLPDSLDGIRSRIGSSCGAAVPRDGGIVAEHVRDIAVHKLRLIRHMNDNLWMSIRASANLGRGALALSDSAGVDKATGLLCGCQRRGHLPVLYEQVYPLAQRLPLRGMESTYALFRRSMLSLHSLRESARDPGRLFTDALRCAEDLRRVSETLVAAREPVSHA